MESPARAHYLGAEGANLTEHFSIENMVKNEIVLIIPYSESLWGGTLRLPQVLIKPRKMHSSSFAVHWRRHAELG